VPLKIESISECQESSTFDNMNSHIFDPKEHNKEENEYKIDLDSPYKKL